jgi:hypothetical protein
MIFYASLSLSLFQHSFLYFFFLSLTVDLDLHLHLSLSHHLITKSVLPNTSNAHKKTKAIEVAVDATNPTVFKLTNTSNAFSTIPKHCMAVMFER